MKNIKLFSIIIILSFFVSSCETYYYAPTEQTVLKFTEKKEVSASVGYNLIGFVYSDNSSWDKISINAGYSFTNYFGVNSNYQRFHKKDYFLDNELIFYKKVKKYFYPAINFGYTYGNRNGDLYDLQMNRIYAQPSLGFSNNYFDFAISTRFARVDYDLDSDYYYYYDCTNGQCVNVITKNEIPQYSAEHEIYTIYDKRKELRVLKDETFYFIEPAVTVGVGYKILKLRLQWAKAIQQDKYTVNHIEENFFLSINLRYNISLPFKEQW